MRELNEQEEKTLKTTAEVWSNFIKLETLHPDEADEFRHMLHELQRMIICRPYADMLKKEKLAEETIFANQENLDAPVEPVARVVDASAMGFGIRVKKEGGFSWVYPMGDTFCNFCYPCFAWKTRKQARSVELYLLGIRELYSALDVEVLSLEEYAATLRK